MARLRFLRCLLITTLGILFFVKSSYADIVFPAVARQFMISTVVPFYYSVILAALILLVETFFIQKMFAINCIIGFILSFIINLISSISGVFIVTFVEGWTRDIYMWFFGYSNLRLDTYLGIIPGYMLTVLLEGILLFLIASIIKKKQKMISCMRTSVIMNCCSYFIILIGVIIVDIMTKGANFNFR